jgi:hypothetical protein
MALEEDQKKHIRNKIRELGTMNKINKFYSQNDLVSEYAKKIASSLLFQDKTIEPRPVKGQLHGRRIRKPITKGKNSQPKPKRSNSHSKDAFRLPSTAIANQSDHNCIECGEPIPEARLKITPQPCRCVECQQTLERKNPDNCKRKIDEGLAGSREDHKRLKARDWGAMVNRNK